MREQGVKSILISKLRQIYDDRDFVIGVMSNASHIEDRETIIAFIERGEDVTVENIILLSAALDQRREAMPS